MRLNEEQFKNHVVELCGTLMEEYNDYLIQKLENKIPDIDIGNITVSAITNFIVNSLLPHCQNFEKNKSLEVVDVVLVTAREALVKCIEKFSEKSKMN